MKIPDDVFETRCQYCVHNMPEGKNEDIRPEHVFSQYLSRNRSCKILGICKCREIPGECLSFSPNRIYGICYTCEYSNSFHAGFCTRITQPNKRKIYIGNGGLKGAAKPDYWQEHVLSTCDAYRPNAYWIDIMKNQAAEGKIPRNFDPETMQAIGPAISNEIEERWDAIDQKRTEEAAAKKEKEQAERLEQAEQLTLF